MKIIVFVLTLIFSFSVLADCCNSEIQVESISKKNVTDADDCGDAEHSEHHGKTSCHCPASCMIKIILKDKIIVSINNRSVVQAYLDHHQIYKNLDPLPILQPPISLI